MIFDVKTIFLILVTGILPTIIWLLFWLEEDRKNPEPKNLLVRGFILGGLAVILAFYFEQLAIRFLGPFSSPAFDLALSLPTLRFIALEIPLLLSWAFIEEVAKYLVASVGLFTNKNFDEPIDAMIYMITVALGFSAFENSLFLVNTLLNGNDQIYFLMTGNLRFLGATVLHLVSSALVGSAIALAFCARTWVKTIVITLGIIGATLLHALFNFFIIINNGENILGVLLLLWLGAFFVIYLFERAKVVVCGNNFVTLFLKAKNNTNAKR